MSRSKWSFVALLVLASSSGLAVAQGAAPPPGTIAEEVISENDGGADSPDLAVTAESQPALAAEVDEAPSAEPPAPEENPFADMIGMTQKELRKKWGRPSQNSPGTNGDGVYFYDIEPDVMVVVVIRDKKVFRIRAYQQAD